MPTINNETVIGSGYVTYRNARPQLLSNGWIVAAVYSSSATRLQFRVKKTSAGAWEDLAFLTTSNVLSWSLQVKGTRVFATLHTLSSNATSFLNFDATTVSSSTTLSASAIDNTSTSGSYNGEDLTMNDAGTELHHVFSSRTSVYPNCNNIRYLKGTIATDGSVSWSSVEQITTYNGSSTGSTRRDPSIVWSAGGFPVISFKSYDGGSSAHYIQISRKISGAWTTLNAFYDNYFNELPAFTFVPQSINGLTNGRIWLTWQGADNTNTSTKNVRTSYSDDNGATWAAQTKHTSGNIYNQNNSILTADRTGKVFLYWDGEEDASGNTVTVTKEKVYSNGVWGATTSISGDNHFNVTALYDPNFTLGMTRAPIMRWYASGVRFTGNYFAPAVVSPSSSALGNKETSNVLSYTVTPDPGSTITSIVEKANGTTVNTYSNPASLSRTFTIPLANWDALKYYNTHTISVTVTDSNGMANTQTYTFNKALANDASLLEGAKAAKDGKDRISTKRDVLAGQVGLPAGSTFDAISAAISSNTMKVANETGTISITTTSNKLTVNNLAYRPEYVIISVYYGTYAQTVVLTDNNLIYNTSGVPTAVARGVAGGTTIFETTTFGSRFSITDNGFSAELIVGGTTGGTANYKWVALG